MFDSKTVFSDDELLGRALKNRPSFWDSELNRPSSGFFRVSSGCSFNRQGDRSRIELIEVTANQFYSTDGKSKVALLRVIQLLDMNLFIVKDQGNSINPYHCCVYQNQQQEKITYANARKLAESCEVVEAE